LALTFRTRFGRWKKEGSPGEPLAVKAILGWSIAGLAGASFGQTKCESCDGYRPKAKCAASLAVGTIAFTRHHASKPSAAGRPRGRKPPSGRFFVRRTVTFESDGNRCSTLPTSLAPLDQGVFVNTARSTEVARCAEESCRGRYGTVVRRASPS